MENITSKLIEEKYLIYLCSDGMESIINDSDSNKVAILVAENQLIKSKKFINTCILKYSEVRIITV